MAKERTLKEGLEFFPLDIDYFDDSKILMIESKFGLMGSVVATRLLCSIYRQGYYMRWSDDEALVLARRVGNGVTWEDVNKIVDGLIDCEFFDHHMFEAWGILTSRGIQVRWQKIINDCNRKARLKSDFNLIIQHQKSDFLHQKSEESPQSKVKESKGEESKVIPLSATPEILRKEQDLITAICEYFEVKTVVTGPTYNLICEFAETAKHRNELDIVSLALQKYMAYKARSQETRHGVTKWIGTREAYFLDGAWMEYDWDLKLKNYEQQAVKGTSRTTSAQVGGADYSKGLQ